MTTTTRCGGRGRWALRSIPLVAVCGWLLVASASAECSYDANGVGYGDTCQNENSNGAGGYRAPAPNYNDYYQQQMMRQRQQYLQQQRQLFQEQRQKELQRQKSQARAAAKARFIAARNAAAASLKGGSCCSSGELKTGTGSALFQRRNSNSNLRGEGPTGSSGSTAFDNLKAWAGASRRAKHAHTATDASALAGLTPDKGGGFAGDAPVINPPTPAAQPVVSERVARDPAYRKLTEKMQLDQREARRDQNRVNALIAKKTHASGTDRETIDVELANASNELSAAQSKAATDDVLRTNRAKQVEDVYDVVPKRPKPTEPPVPKLAPGVH